MRTPTPEPRTPIYDKPWGPTAIVGGFLIFANLVVPLLANLVVPLLAELVSGSIR